MTIKEKEAILTTISEMLDKKDVAIEIIKKIDVTYEPGNREPKTVQTRGKIIIIETGPKELKIDTHQFTHFNNRVQRR